MSLVTTDAVILHAFDYLESSRIVRLVTREAGLVSVLARGARSSKRRFGMGLDLFASGVAQLELRHGRDLHALTAFDLTSARRTIADDLRRFAAASALSEVVLRFAADGEVSDLFGELSAVLDALAGAPADVATTVGLAGGWRLVATLGFAPALEACSRCHAAIAEGEPLAFRPAAGGALCAACAADGARLRHLPPSAHAALREWLTGAGLAHRPLLTVGEQRAHLRLLREFLHEHLADGRPLQATESWTRTLATLEAPA